LGYELDVLVLPILTNDYENPDGLVELFMKATSLSKKEIELALREANFFEREENEFRSYKHFSDAIQAVNIAKTMGYEVGIISDVNKQWGRPSAREKALFNLFHPSLIFYSYELRKTKSDPSIFEDIRMIVGLDAVLKFVDNRERLAQNAVIGGFNDSVVLNHEQLKSMNHEYDQYPVAERGTTTKVATTLVQAVELLCV